MKRSEARRREEKEAVRMTGGNEGRNFLTSLFRTRWSACDQASSSAFDSQADVRRRRRSEPNQPQRITHPYKTNSNKSEREERKGKEREGKKNTILFDTKSLHTMMLSFFSLVYWIGSSAA